MIELVEAIKQCGLEAVLLKYKLTAIRHKKYSKLVLLKYSQLESPMGEKIVQQARGIILDSDRDWQVVSFPYTKFFNYGEGRAAEIDWNSAKVYEKLDGSLMTLYWYDSQWQVASSGTPDASGNVHACKLTFAELFWQVFEEMGYQSSISTSNCYMFEMLTPYNRVITRFEGNKLILHGAREMSSYKEIVPAAVAIAYGWECVRTHHLNNWEGILEAAKNLDPMVSEGYIVCDAKFNRVKIKSPQYVALAHLKGGFGVRRMVEIIRANEGCEFLSYFPEWTALYTSISEAYQNLIMEIDSDYARLQSIELQKDFATEAKQTRCPGILFALRSGKSNSATHALTQMPIRSLEALLDIEESAIA